MIEAWQWLKRQTELMDQHQVHQALNDQARLSPKNKDTVAVGRNGCANSQTVRTIVPKQATTCAQNTFPFINWAILKYT